jgi:hypothetical protein
MPAVYSAYGLRQTHLPPKPKPEAGEAARAPSFAPLTAATQEVRETVRRMWGKPLKEIAEAIGRSTGHVSRIARELGLPSRKHTPRTPGLKSGRSDQKLREVWERDDLTDAEKAKVCDFSSVYCLRRRAMQLGMKYRPTRHAIEETAA